MSYANFNNAAAHTVWSASRLEPGEEFELDPMIIAQDEYVRELNARNVIVRAIQRHGRNRRWNIARYWPRMQRIDNRRVKRLFKETGITKHIRSFL